jgi:TrmH family RNA methyltransferase
VPLVVLVRTHSPGNLGAAARAAKNFGAELALLDPRADRAHPDARAFASGAEDVLDAAAILSDLDQLRRRASFVAGLTSLRGRLVRGLPPRLDWSRLRSGALGGSFALVFGPERGGLTTDELRAMNGRLSIPTEDALQTMNLAQAVAAALALARPRGRPAPEQESERASSAELARLVAALGDTLRQAGYPAPGHSKDAPAEIASSLLRAEPSAREVKLWLGALGALRRAATGGPRRGPRRGRAQGSTGERG